MAGRPGFEFTSDVFFPRLAQFGHDAGVLRGEPVLKFVERLHRREDGCGNFDCIRCHGIKLSVVGGIASGRSHWQSPNLKLLSVILPSPF